jgi:hypothetical protein
VAGGSRVGERPHGDGVGRLAERRLDDERLLEGEERQRVGPDAGLPWRFSSRPRRTRSGVIGTWSMRTPTAS